jgi:hypothetical protein
MYKNITPVMKTFIKDICYFKRELKNQKDDNLSPYAIKIKKHIIKFLDLDKSVENILSNIVVP